jgi:hypothetical protein
MPRSVPPQPSGSLWSDWAIRLNTYLNIIRNKLQFKDADDSASEDGIILWDPEIDHVVVSYDNVFEPLAWGHNSYGAFYSTATITAASINTATAIAWPSTALSQDVAIDGTYTSRIVFTYGGTYQIDFSCELTAANSNDKTVYIWPRKNGTDIPYSTIVHSVKNSGESKVVSRSGIFEVEAGDYIEAYFAVTDTGLTIDGSAATAFSPAAPSATIMVTELR